MAIPRFALQQSATEVLEKERRLGSFLRSFYHKAWGPAFAHISSPPCSRPPDSAALAPSEHSVFPRRLHPRMTQKRFAAYRDMN